MKNWVCILDEFFFIKGSGSTLWPLLTILLCLHDHVITCDVTFILIHLEGFQKTEKEKKQIQEFTEYHLVL